MAISQKTKGMAMDSMSEQKPLNVLLDEIEETERTLAQQERVEDIMRAAENVILNYRKLVKALRSLWETHKGLCILGSETDGIAADRVTRVETRLTAILNGEETGADKNLGEPGAII